MHDFDVPMNPVHLAGFTQGFYRPVDVSCLKPLTSGKPEENGDLTTINGDLTTINGDFMVV